MLTLDRLRYFVEAASLEHVGKVAKNLNTSPSVISSAISTLEEELGTKLFFKEKNRLKLNQNGIALLEKSNDILAKVEQLYAHSLDNEPCIKGHFKIAASPFLMR